MSHSPQQIALFELDQHARPMTPLPNTREYLALKLMANGERLTTPFWQKLGYGWRLAATIHNLNAVGWNVESARVKYGHAHIGIYSLSACHAKLFLEAVQ